jgi:hypothetical protein
MAGSGFIHTPRCSTPKPSSKAKIPAKNQTKPTSIKFSQEELSRRAKGSKVLKRPGGGGPSNKA